MKRGYCPGMDDHLHHEPARKRRSDQANPVFYGVEQAIHEQRLPPGTRLAESDLSEIYGVSRTIVRSALQALSHAQLVTIKPNRGARVAKPSPRSAREVFEARELIEARLASEAARHATPMDVKRLRSHCAEEHDALDTGELGRALHLSGVFHIEIARISQQHTLLAFVEQLVARSALIIALYARRERVRCDSGSHEHLIQALSDRNPTEAEALMRSHLIDIHSSLYFDDDLETRGALRDILRT